MVRMAIIEHDPPEVVIPLAIAPTDAPPAAADAPVDAPADTGRFHALLVVEGVPTGDNRMFVENAFTWRDLPLPFMAKDTDGHGEMITEAAVLIGNIDTIERQGLELHGWGAYLSTPDEQAAGLIALVKSGELRGVSVDPDEVEFEILLELPPEAPPEVDTMDEVIDEETGSEMPKETIDGVDYLVMDIPNDIMRVTKARIMGATVVPFQAFMEARIIDGNDSSTPPAGGVTDPEVPAGDATAAITPAESAALVAAGISIPVTPPGAWFDPPAFDEPTALTVDDDGRVYGHLATWGSCHVGYPDSCVTPPKSMSNYGYFNTGELRTAEGERVYVGQITLTGGHADLSLSMAAAKAHYDDTRSAVADVTAGEDQFGIWLAGALRPGTSPTKVRAALAAAPSGDWRPVAGNRELISVQAVNVPGFPVVRGRIDGALVASLPVRTLPGERHRRAAAALRNILAEAIGRDPASRKRALYASVHPEPET